MNLFIVHPDADVSARMLAQADPRRARKQLLEACQLLAAVDHAIFGETAMLRADGRPYGNAHPHHPITLNMRQSHRNWLLAYSIALGLARQYRGHACSKSFFEWAAHTWPAHRYGGDYVFCRKGQPQQRFTLLKDYVLACRAYLTTAKGMTLPTC